MASAPKAMRCSDAIALAATFEQAVDDLRRCCDSMSAAKPGEPIGPLFIENERLLAEVEYRQLAFWDHLAAHKCGPQS
jgi:hypothetical protein